MKKKFLIVAAGWNCEKYIRDFARGVKEQTFKDFNLLIVNDASTDNTVAELDKHFMNWGVENGINIIIYTAAKNMGGYHSYTNAMKTVPQDTYDIAMWHGLDDRMLPNALEEVNKKYLEGAYMTYGTYINKSGFVFKDLFYPEETHATRDYRHSKFRATAIRSFRKELYFAIPEFEQCDIERNIYYDLEIAFSLLEMCGKERIGVIDFPIYEYNNLRPDSCANLHGRNYDVYNKICSRPKRDLMQL